MDRLDDFYIDLDFSRDDDLGNEILNLVEKSKEKDDECISFLQENHIDD